MAQFVKKGKAKTGGKDSKGKAVAKAEIPILNPAALKKERPQVPPGKMKICVIGPGAIGGLVAAYLKDKLRDVFIVGKPEQVRAIKNNGLKVEGVRGTVYVAIDAREKLDQKVDLIILTVKTQDIKEVLDKNRNFLRDTLILTTQNGVKADKILSIALGEQTIVSSIVMFGSTYLKPGEITHNFEGKWIIGRPFSANDDKVKEIEYELSPAFEVAVVDNIMSMKWTKLFVNFNNCIPAILGKSMQETFANLEMAKLAIRLLKEGFQIIDKVGTKLMNLPDFDLDKFRGLTQMPLEQAAQIFSGIMANLSKEPLYGSILQSIKRGKPSEIDYINGEVVGLARFNDTDARLNAKMVELVHRVEKKKQFFTTEQFFKELEFAEALI